jgi:hypothetical protein
MDPVRNPFAPGAGSRPPELAGRDPVIEMAAETAAGEGSTFTLTLPAARD